MERSFKDYINNPLGNKNAVFSAREMYKNMYTEKFNLIMVRENSKIDYYLYKDDKKENNNYYIHLKIPSERLQGFYYDVFIQFIPTKTSELENTLDNYIVKFFSNDPSFVYTFAHSFIKNEMFVNDMKSKMSKIAVKRNADIKNPDNQIGYVKSLYFSYLFMKMRGLFNKVHYESAEKYYKSRVLSNIDDADEKMRLQREADEAAKKARKKEVKLNQQNVNKMLADNEQIRIKSVSTTKKINSGNKSKFINKTKTTKKF